MSPDGTVVATFVGRSIGGAVGGSLTHYVVVHRSGEPPRLSDAVIRLDGASRVCLRWITARDLEVSYQNQARVLHRVNQSARPLGIRVSFNPIPSRDEGLHGTVCDGCWTIVVNGEEPPPCTDSHGRLSPGVRVR